MFADLKIGTSLWKNHKVDLTQRQYYPLKNVLTLFTWDLNG